MKKLTVALLLILAALQSFAGNLKFANIIGSNMVLQQNSDERIWGQAAPRADVSVSASWRPTPATTKADAKGNWELTIKTPAASFDPQTLTASSGSETVELTNILIGELWFCSGQSNMELTLGGGRGLAIEGSLDEIAMSNQYSAVRSFNVRKKAAVEPAAEVEGEWQVTSPATAASFSAVGYFFATRLSKALNIPVGFINASWGGSVIEAWMSADLLKNSPDIKLSDASNKEVNDMYKPMIMYNGMLYPCTKLNMAGFIWFQGESNISIATDVYADRLAAMAQKWRSDVGCGDIPFIIVELTPYDYFDGMYGLQDEHGPLVREQQYMASTRIPNAAIIGTNDLAYSYERNQVHQSQKRQIGERACYHALNLAYGYTDLPCKNPSFNSFEVKDGKAIVRFDNARSGFMLTDEIKGFEIAGAGGYFHPADAQVMGSTVILSTPAVPEPKHVRYCFHDYEIGTLKGTNGLPTIPFRASLAE